MQELVEFENEKTGITRKFPKVLFDSLVHLCLRNYPHKEWDRVEAQVSAMVATFLDEGDAAHALRAAASALYPEIDGIHYNSYPVDLLKIKIQGWADRMYARYGAPVWLVGSAITGAGRDVDIRIVIPDPDFDARFPDLSAWALEVGKQGRHAALFCRMNVDFQIQRASEVVEFEDLPRVRLDACAYPEAKELPPPDFSG